MQIMFTLLSKHSGVCIPIRIFVFVFLGLGTLCGFAFYPVNNTVIYRVAQKNGANGPSYLIANILKIS